MGTVITLALIFVVACALFGLPRRARHMRRSGEWQSDAPEGYNQERGDHTADGGHGHHRHGGGFSSEHHHGGFSGGDHHGGSHHSGGFSGGDSGGGFSGGDSGGHHHG